MPALNGSPLPQGAAAGIARPGWKGRLHTRWASDGCQMGVSIGLVSDSRQGLSQLSIASDGVSNSR